MARLRHSDSSSAHSSFTARASACTCSRSLRHCVRAWDSPKKRSASAVKRTWPSRTTEARKVNCTSHRTTSCAKALRISQQKWNKTKLQALYNHFIHHRKGYSGLSCVTVTVQLRSSLTYQVG